MRRTTWASQNLRCESTPERARQHWVRRKGIACGAALRLLRGLLALIMAAGTGGGFLAEDIATHACPIAQVWRGRPVGRRNGPTEMRAYAHPPQSVWRASKGFVPDESLHERHSKCVRHSKWEPDNTNNSLCCMGCIRMPCVARRSAWRPCLVQSEAVLPRPKTAYGWPVTVASAEKGHGAAHGGRWEAPGRRLRASVPSAAARDASYDDARVGENELHQHLPL
jgi:hypothetical protein